MRPVADTPAIGKVLQARVEQAKREREAATGEKISLRDLSAATAVAVNTLQGILRGVGDPKASAVVALARYLRVRAGWLLGE